MARVIHSTIASLIKNSCISKADDVFLADETQSLTGKLLWARIASVANQLFESGFKKGDVVAFYCTSSIPQAVTFFACLVSGIIPCCLHTRETNERNRKNIKFIKAKALFSDRDLSDQAEALIKPNSIIILSQEFIKIRIEKKLATDVAPSDLALVLISSGTTGEPKCISHTQETLAATAEYGPYNYECWSDKDSTIVIMAPSFAAWIHTVLPFIFIQGRIVFCSSFDPSNFLQTLEVEQITLAPLVPTIWRKVFDAKPENYDLSKLKSVFFSGEPGSDNLVKDLQKKIGLNVITSYLASEGGCASGVVAGSDILSVKGQAASTGYVIEDGQIRIIDPDGSFENILSDGEIGEIALKSNSIAIGYFKNERLSEEKFSNGWWRSGDLGLIGQKGLLYVKGRLDNRINTGGIKVFAEEVEACLLEHPDVQSVAVVGVPDEKWGQKIIAHVVSSWPELDAEDILDYCLENDLLPRTHLPKEIYFHGELPTGPTGKLYRRGLND